jgi:TetR/AcrR family transcriptional regulator, mexJK operon transcriptional repressor
MRKNGAQSEAMRELEIDRSERRQGPAKNRNAARANGPRRGGRLTEARRKEIVELVAPLFLDRGYERVTIDDIVELIGGSKRTLYDRFGGKAGLFEMVIKDYCANVLRDLFTGVDKHASVEKQLIALGTHFLNMILSPRILDTHRLMVSMGRTFPAVAQIIFKAGPQVAYKLFADWIRQLQADGRLGPGDPLTHAELFLDMLIGKHQLALLTSSFDATSPQEIKKTVRAAARLFLNGARSSPTADRGERP